jgi:asparagine synthase (glutamine-hydrolysing)
MCGVAGLWTSASVPLDEVRRGVRRMTDALVHRGPDRGDSWSDADAGLVLGHRRLSIVDLSAAGRQPMVSMSGRYVLSYNGEIYNHRRLRVALGETGPISFRGHSDTEVLLAGIERWGLEGALERCVGMFAFALWDREGRALFLVRDRFGIKPLCFAEVPGGLAFASDASAIRALPEFDGRMDPAAVRLYLRYAYVPSPLSIYGKVRKVLPGTIVRFGAPDATQAVTRTYYDVPAVALRAAERGFAGSEEEAIDAVEAAIGEAVGDRLVADVPVGAFLSGGIDSSTVVALAQRAASRPLKTFCVGTTDPAYDESGPAAAIARHLGTEHTTLMATPDEAMAALRELPLIHDEPFADASQIPTFLVSRLARGQVTVALSGDGGDEVFGGYNRHVYAPRVFRHMRRIPARLRRLASRGLLGVPPATWDAVHRQLRERTWGTRFVPDMVTPGQKVHKLARLLPASSLGELYESLCAQWPDPDALVRAAPVGEGPRVRPPLEPLQSRFGDAGALMLADLVSYLPDDILTKVDRASMAVSLEARVPLLDHRVVELAWRLPLPLKVRGQESKRALRGVLRRHVPEALYTRPKMGFGLPIGEWLRGPLRPWCEELLSVPRLRDAALLAPEPVRAAWAEHLSRRADRTGALWTVLVLQAWIRRVV